MGRKHKAGTGNMKHAPAARIISKKKVSFGIQATSQACGLPLPWHMSNTWQHTPHAAFLDVQASSSGAEAGEPRNVIIKLRGLPRPEAPPRCPTSITFDTYEDAFAALKSANNICTCRIGVPSFLCRCFHCWAFEVGTCEPDIHHGEWCDDISTWPDLQYRTGWRVRTNCRCIMWDLISDNGQLKDQSEEEGKYLSRFNNTWGEHDEFCVTERWRGDWRTAIRLWPPPRALSCDHCSGFGTYVPTCTAEDCKRARRGRSILVIGDDVAVACAIKCKGHGTSRRSCGLETLPDVVIDRRTVDY